MSVFVVVHMTVKFYQALDLWECGRACVSPQELRMNYKHPPY